MLFILYQNTKQGLTGFDEVDAQYSEELEANWRAAHPNKFLIGIFNAESDLSNAEKARKDRFMKYCGRYGFNAGDYRAPIINNGETYLFADIKPQNRKYPCILRPTRQGVRGVKATPDFIKSRI